MSRVLTSLFKNDSDISYSGLRLAIAPLAEVREISSSIIPRCVLESAAQSITRQMSAAVFPETLEHEKWFFPSNLVTLEIGDLRTRGTVSVNTEIIRDIRDTPCPPELYKAITGTSAREFFLGYSGLKEVDGVLCFKLNLTNPNRGRAYVNFSGAYGTTGTTYTASYS